MPIGAGRYDAECTEMRERLGAVGVILIVVGGNRGNGFAAQLPAEIVLATPAILRRIAKEIETSGGTG